jgi:LacI family transcriptional regulator
LGYEPNITARRLQKRRTDTLGLILPAITPRVSDPFFSELLTGIVEETNRHGYDLLVSLDSSVEEETQHYLKFIRSRQVDGFIIVRIQRRDARIRLLKEQGFPFVAFGRVNGENDFPLIDEDGELGIRMIVNHLVGLGHTRFACVSEPLNFTKSFLRVQGYRQGLVENGIAVDEKRIIPAGFRQQSGYQITKRLLDLAEPPTAIVTVNDLLALGAIRAAQERGLTVGKDVSITGFDDILLAEYAQPPLTTVHLSAHQIGMRLCQMLVKVILGQEIEEKQIIMKPELIVRYSTGPVRR